MSIATVSFVQMTYKSSLPRGTENSKCFSLCSEIVKTDMFSSFDRLQKKTQHSALAAEAEKTSAGTGKRTRYCIRGNSQKFRDYLVVEKWKKHISVSWKYEAVNKIIRNFVILGNGTKTIKEICTIFSCTGVRSLKGRPLPVVASSISAVEVTKGTLMGKGDSYKPQMGTVLGKRNVSWHAVLQYCFLYLLYLIICQYDDTFYFSSFLSRILSHKKRNWPKNEIWWHSFRLFSILFLLQKANVVFCYRIYNPYGVKRVYYTGFDFTYEVLRVNCVNKKYKSITSDSTLISNFESSKDKFTNGLFLRRFRKCLILLDVPYWLQ